MRIVWNFKSIWVVAVVLFYFKKEWNDINKATTEYRETKLANLRVIIRKPYCEIDTENVATLQFLDLIKEVVDISEVDGEELGISFGTALIVLLALYFIIKWAVKNGIKEAYRDITGKVITEDIEAEQICNEEEK